MSHYERFDDDTDAAWHHQTETEQRRNQTMNSRDLNALSIDELVPKQSKFLSKEDVGEEGTILTIKGFKKDIVGDGDEAEEKTIMYFMEDVKPMILNRTNAQLVGVCTGATTAGEARGKKVVVYNDPTIGFGGKITGGIRIKKATGNPKSMNDIDESEIPF